MKSTKKVLKTSVEFTVELDKNDFEPARLKALERLARDIKIPGFRNGKAPASKVEQHVDPNDLASHTLDFAVRRAIPKLFDEAGLLPVSIPHVDIIKYIPGEMAEVKVIADIMPEVKLGKYDKLKATYEERVVSEKDVEDVLNRIAESYAEPKVVKRAAKLGDETIIDFKGMKDGVAFDGGTAKDYKLRLGSGQFIPGFEEGIVGHEVGDKFDLDITFPEDYGAAELAGQKVVFEILVKQISELETPAIDDALAEKSGAFKTLKELKEDIKKNLEARANQEADEKYKNDLLDELVAASTTEAPKSLVDEQAEHIRDDIINNLRSRGATLEDYLKANKKEEADWLAEVREIAEKRAIQSIIVQKLTDELKIEVSEEAVEKQLEELRMVYKNSPDATKQLEDPRVVTSIRNRMRVEMTMDQLVELNRPNAKVVKKPAFEEEEKPAKKATKKAPAKKASKK